MRLFRIFVLLLVCVLLPFRGAVAATMLCAEPGQTNEVAAEVGHAHHGMHGDDVDDHADQRHADKGVPTVDYGAKSDSCHICASGCHAAAMVMELPSAPDAMPVASVVFPALNAPAPDFQSEGQDRPPRAI